MRESYISRKPEIFFYGRAIYTNYLVISFPIFYIHVPISLALGHMIQQSSGNSYLSSETGTSVSFETHYELFLSFFLETLFVIFMC